MPLDGVVGFTTVVPEGFIALAVAYARRSRCFLVLVGSPDASLAPMR